MVDHTNVDQDNLFAGFSITCFVRAATIDALPPVERGDVIAMRNVTVRVDFVLLLDAVMNLRPFNRSNNFWALEG